MFNRNKKQAEPKKKHDLSQFGLFDVPTDLDNMGDDDENDSDLEAELAAITSGGGKARPKPKAKPKVEQSELDRMVAESLRDIGSDEELSGDDDDPDLLNELSAIAGGDGEADDSPAIEDVATPSTPLVGSPLETPKKDEVFVPTTTTNTADLLKTRIQMYREAENNAKTANETARAKRFARGLKTLESLLKQVNAGKAINPEEIPPEVFVKPAQGNGEGGSTVAAPAEMPDASSPTRPAPLLPVAPSSPVSEPAAPISPIVSTFAPNANDEKITALLLRQKEYKEAALASKKSGDKASALQYVKIVKVFDQVIVAARAGEAVDLSDMPPPPGQLSLADLTPQQPTPTAAEPIQPPKQEAETQKSEEPPAAAAEALITASSVLEALQQRLDVFKAAAQSAKEQGNSSKARRSERIVKQFEDAIKQYKAGRPVAYEELPTPPGFGPIPVPSAGAARPAAPAPVAKPTPVTPSSPPSASKLSPEKSPSTRPILQKQDSRVGGNHSATSLMNKTIEILLQRQREFKEAALAAKKAGELEQAKEYLKIWKGFESMLDAARGGLPVDLSTLPISPSQRQSLEESFVVVSDGEDTHSKDDLHDVISRLEEQLQKQLTMCKTTRDHHKALGDVAGTNRFENLALSVQKDLDILKLARRKKIGVPKFHYEQKSFNILKCNTDLAETQLEINVIRGIGYHVSNPKNVDTYVKVEFPYPQETPYRTKTQVIYDSDSPEYNETFIAEIQPKQRLCQRTFKRYAIKCEVYAKGGFFRTDPLIGTATVKLQPLETGVEIHDSFELMDGRKSVGGKLEVKIRIRHPIVSKQMENITEKWLIIDV